MQEKEEEEEAAAAAQGKWQNGREYMARGTCHMHWGPSSVIAVVVQ